MIIMTGLIFDRDHGDHKFCFVPRVF